MKISGTVSLIKWFIIKKSILYWFIILYLFILSPFSVFAKSYTEDKNNDGKEDLWKYYGDKGKLERVEIDSDFDGQIDTWQSYQNERIFNIIRDTDFDGKKDTRDYFEAGLQMRQEQDRNGDGKIDLWVRFNENKKILFADKDINHDGKPDLWIEYDKKEKPKVEKGDRNFDGIIDVIKEYQKGELSEVQRDTDFNCKIDTWDYYEQGKIARQEQDKNEENRCMVLF